MKKKIKIKYFNVIVLLSAIISSTLLLHDIIVYGIIPLINHKYYTVTYYGMFIELIALFTLEVSLQIIKDW